MWSTFFTFRQESFGESLEIYHNLRESNVQMFTQYFQEFFILILDRKGKMINFQIDITKIFQVHDEYYTKQIHTYIQEVYYAQQ